jgi:hypothetical protein
LLPAKADRLTYTERYGKNEHDKIMNTPARKVAPMRMLLLTIACAGALLAAPPPAAAALITFHASLSGAQETPPNGSPATGSATLVADTVAQTLSVSEVFSGLLGPTGAGHIHAAPPGVAGPIILPFAEFPVGVTSGSFTGTFSAADLTNQATSGITNFTDLLNALEAGNTYVNIHTTPFPGGEIRGQVLTVSEPVSLTLLGVGLGGLGFARTRRQSRSA